MEIEQCRDKTPWKEDLKRKECLRVINIQCEENYQSEMALNMSESGMYIKGHEMPPVGSNLASIFRNPQKGMLNSAGEVVWKDRNGMGVCSNELKS